VFVIVASMYGAFSVNRRILVVQGLPALISLVLLWLT
jgi:putative membrane protein